MRFNFEVKGDAVEIMRREIDLAERAVSRGVRAAGSGLKSDWRAQVRAAGLGGRLANTVRAADYPSGFPSIGAAALVYSRAPIVVDAHDRGALITRSDVNGSPGVYLAIPLGNVQKMRSFRGFSRTANHRITPAGWEQKTGRRLRFVYRKGRPSLLVDDGTPMRRSYHDPYTWQRSVRGQRRARVWTPIFMLVRQAKLRKKMNLDQASEAWGNKLPGLVLANWRDL